MKYKALMLDLDGTTVPNRLDGMPSPRIIEAITKAQEQIAVCIATGRSLEQATPVLDALNITDPVILLNGALVIDGKSRKPLYERPLVKKDYEKAIQILNKRAYATRISIDESGKTHDYDQSYTPQNPLTIFVWDLSHEEAEELITALTKIPTLSAHKVIGWETGKVGVTINHIYGTKQHGILEAAKILGIHTRSIIGIGDGPNDFPLLMACGLKVAIGNAIPDLKAIADYVAPTVQEDGVADVIEKFILNSKSKITNHK